MHEHDQEQGIAVDEVTCEVCLNNISTSVARRAKAADYIAFFCGLECYEQWQYQRLPNNSAFNIDFLAGICCLWESDYQQARHFFLLAVTETEPLDVNHNVYSSYLALSDVLLDHKNGNMNHGHHPSDTSVSIEPEIQLNQACAEFIKGNRKRGIQAMDKLNDLHLSSKSSDEIHSFFDIVGKRKQNNSGSLKRNNLIHKSIGKIFRKNENVNTIGRVEAFIRETAKNRYNCIAVNI